jgi:hypothetical protein
MWDFLLVSSSSSSNNSSSSSSSSHVLKTAWLTTQASDEHQMHAEQQLLSS